MKDYQKVLLYVYPRIERIVRDIDGMVRAQAYAVSGTESGERVAERIAEYICVKGSFLYLKERLEEMLSRLNKEELYMLEYKYFRRRKKLKGEFCGYALDYNERTYFRRQARLSDKLNASLLREGMNEAWFSEHFSDVGFMMTALENVKNGVSELTDKRRRKALACANKRARGKRAG